MIEEITKIIGDIFLAEAFINNLVELSVNDITLTELTARSIALYTFQIISDKAFRVVIRNLLPTIEPDNMKAAIENVGPSS